jgi:hypothetical protein
MARPPVLKDSMVVSVRLEREIYDQLKDIAALETINTDRSVTPQELIRNALKFVYSDNEKLRECFRRSRAHIAKKMFK